MLNKSAIVLISAVWEAYCEDIAAEGLAHLVAHSKTHDALPKELQKMIAKELEKEPHELAVWGLAGDGWRKVITDRLERPQTERARRLNTPKSTQIDELFLTAIGINKVSSGWKWSGMTVTRAREKLDDYVTLRGEIAHRGQTSKGVRRDDVEDFLNHVRRLVGKTGGRVNTAVTAATGKRLW